MSDIIEKTQAKRVITGTFTDTKKSLLFWKEKGVKNLSYSVDVSIFYNACRSVVLSV